MERQVPPGSDDWQPFGNWINFPEGSVVLFKDTRDNTTALLMRFPIESSAALSLLETQLRSAGFQALSFQSDSVGFSFVSQSDVVTGVVQSEGVDYTTLLLHTRRLNQKRVDHYGITGVMSSHHEDSPAARQVSLDVIKTLIPLPQGATLVSMTERKERVGVEWNLELSVPLSEKNLIEIWIQEFRALGFKVKESPETASLFTFYDRTIAGTIVFKRDLGQTTAYVLIHNLKGE